MSKNWRIRSDAAFDAWSFHNENIVCGDVPIFEGLQGVLRHRVNTMGYRRDMNAVQMLRLVKPLTLLKMPLQTHF